VKNKKYILVLIEWYDAEADCSWAEEKDIDKWMKEDFLAIEVGWVIRETKDIICMCSSIGNDGTIGNRTKIPKPWIKSRKEIGLHNGHPTRKNSRIRTSK